MQPFSLERFTVPLYKDENLFKKALDYASRFQPISQNEKDLLLHTKRSLLFDQGTPWTKKDSKEFDVTMGSYDGAEACELVGLYLLSQLQNLNIQVGLYRDDGLAVTNTTPKQAEKIKQEIAKIFKKHNLKITIEANKKIINYLDVTLDINNQTYRPYKKPNDTPLYVNTKSNHPPTVIRAIPKGIEKRLSNISSTNEIFEKAAPEYQEALEKSGHKTKLKYQEENKATSSNKEQRRKRGRNITWFNPPYNKNTKTNIGKEFLKLLDYHFPKGHKLHQICNRNTIKISYSCMPNMKNIIDATNRKKQSLQQEQPGGCNCRNKDDCPLENQCLKSNIVYQASVTTEHETQKYVGATETAFKTRFANHKLSFKHERYKNQTELSKYIWELKEKDTKYTIKWKILREAQAYSNISKRCNLCLTEKWIILCKPDWATLNSRAEMINSCRHQNKFFLDANSRGEKTYRKNCTQHMPSCGQG